MRGASWLTAAPPTVAIEIASRRVSVAGIMGSGNGVTLRAVASEALPDGAVVPTLAGQNLPGRDVVIAALSRTLHRAGLAGTKRAALVVPDSIARLSLVPLAAVPSRPAELDQIIRWQMRKATPFPLDQAQVAYFPASRTADATTMAAVLARRDVVAEYEGVAAAVGIHAGTVDLASLNVMNALMAGGTPAPGDSLVVHLSPEATTLAILRGADLMFYRHRATLEDESLGALVHQTAMYHADRLGGGAFADVWISGDGARADASRAISSRLGVTPHVVDVRTAIEVRDTTMTADLLDAVAAPVGMLLRERKAA